MKKSKIENLYKGANALLQGHFLLSSGKHSQFYLQSAKVLENPKTAQKLAKKLAKQILKRGVKVDCVCSPALGGILAGYELARALGVRFIFTERVNGVMTLRRGFEVGKNERVLVCEDIITTGGSAVESASCVSELGAQIVGFAALANRGVCERTNSEFKAGKNRAGGQNGGKGGKKGVSANSEAKLPKDKPFFALCDFDFEIYQADDCPLCKEGKTPAIKPGSRGN